MTSLLANPKPRVVAKIATLIPRYGEPGSRIPGSQYYRWYCLDCGEPMRVTGQNWPPTYETCEVCAGRHGQVAQPHSGPTDETSGYEHNAIRALEGG